MTPKQEIKQKIFAVLALLFLFALVGSFLFSISLDNKKKTEILQARVAKIKAEEKIMANLSKIHLASSSLPAVSATSYFTGAVTKNGLKKMLQQKDPGFALPIASLTKLMVAVIVLENADTATEIKATTDYIGGEESVFVLETDKVYTVKELLANMLTASDNDSARLLGSLLGTENFVAKMNAKATELGMTKTKYFNVTGLDPKKPEMNLNLSSPTDLFTLLVYIKNKYPDILRLTAQATHNFCDINNYCKPVVSTNKLLTDNPLPFRIIGGKTGSTDIALKNLVVVTEATDDIYLVNIVLGSKDHFQDTITLLKNIIIN